MQVQQRTNFYEVFNNGQVIGYIFGKSTNEWLVFCSKMNMRDHCRSYTDAFDNLQKLGATGNV